MNTLTATQVKNRLSQNPDIKLVMTLSPQAYQPKSHPTFDQHLGHKHGQATIFKTDSNYCLLCRPQLHVKFQGLSGVGKSGLSKYLAFFGRPERME